MWAGIPVLAHMTEDTFTERLRRDLTATIETAACKTVVIP
jgi:hypothetical protein